MKNDFSEIKEGIDGINYEISPINFIISPTNSIISPINSVIDGINCFKTYGGKAMESKVELVLKPLTGAASAG